MGKKIRMLTTLLLCCAMVFSITACAQEDPVPPNTAPQLPGYMPEDPLELWARFNETMDALSSIEMTINTQKVYYSDGHQYRQHTESYVLSTHDAHYTESESSLSCQSLNLDQTINMVEAFYDGKMYRAVSDGTHDQKFYSEMSHEDYDGLQTGGLTAELALVDCTTAAFSKTADNGWQLDFSGYTKKTIDQAMENLGLTESAMGSPVTDMQVSVTANEDFYVTKMEISFDFAGAGESAPVFTVSTQYNAWNTAVFDATKLNAEEYTQVEDVYLLDAIAAAIQDRQNAFLGQFTLETKTVEQFQNQTRTSEEKGVMIYGLQNNAYCYFFTANTEGKSFIVRYQNGEQTVISNGQSYTADKTEAEAKAYINGLIDSAHYKPLAITSIEKRSDGSYLLISEHPEVSDYVQGIETTFARQEIIVTFADGKLTQIESRLEIEGRFEEDTISIQTESSVMFTEIEEFPNIE